MSWLTKIKEVVLGPEIERTLLAEKRQVPRIKCNIDVKLTDMECKSLSGTLEVIQLSGMRCTIDRALEKGQKISITALEYNVKVPAKSYRVDTIMAEVVWCRKKPDSTHYHAGFRFSEPEETFKNSWVFFVLDNFGLSGSSHQQKRRDIRMTSRIPGECFHLSDLPLSCTITDISVSGVRMLFKREPPDIGSEVTIHLDSYRDLPPLKCYAIIVRSKYNAATGEFSVGARLVKLKNRHVKLLGRYVKTLLTEYASS